MKHFVILLLAMLGVSLGAIHSLCAQREIVYLHTLSSTQSLPLSQLIEGSFSFGAIKVVVEDVNQDQVRFYLLPSKEIDQIYGPYGGVKLVNNKIAITQNGLCRLEIIYKDGKEASYVFYVNCIAKLFQGDKDKVNRAQASLVGKEIRITSDTNLNEVVGVPSGYFTSSWWCIEHDTQYHVVWKKVSSVSLGELLSESKKRYPNQNSWKIFIEMSDGTFNHDQETKELLGRTNIAITLIDERTPVVETHDVTIAPLQNGRIIATPNKAKPGEEVTVEVTPNSGYRLKEGSLKIEAAGKQYPISNRFEMPNTDVTISAEFERISHQVQLYFRNIGEGSVKCWVGDSAREVTSGSLVNAGEMVVFRAEPSPGWKFVCWRDLAGNEYSTDSEIRFIMPYGEPGYYAMVTAEFQQITAILEIEAPKIMLSKQEIFVPGAKFLELYDLQGRLLLENPSSRLIWSGHSGIFMLRIDRKKVEKVLLE